MSGLNRILAGKLAIVTGAGSGIGRSTCQILSREGATVIATDKNLAAAEETIKHFTPPSAGDLDHSFVFMDVAEAQSINKALQQILKKYKRPPTIVVNSGGIARDNKLLDMSELEFDSVINVNLKGTYLVMQATAKAMVDAKVSHGCIINISSMLGKIGTSGRINYTGSKAGVIGITKAAASELGQYNIRVNAVLPGLTDTPIIAHVPQGIKDLVIRQTPLQRIGKPEEIGEVIAFLCSERSSFVTGASIEVSGGFGM
ncbi:(3R)-3-hydroxyacyl-CoA dehydrogenase-like [Arctopsyche grandis]|uniref:(3R)-3-hydroxyacyl-CoA dehydrogenase-like n=1 Tax=Arctopsyche grandis TaxID=121162 RepID=UPI00406D904C